MIPNAENEKLIRSYLLGELADERLHAAEIRLLEDDEFAAQLQLVESELVDEYLDDAMTNEERDKFDRHFLAAPHHRRQLAVTRALRRQAETVTALIKTKASESTSNISFSSVSWWQRWFGLRPALAWAVACVLLLSLSIPTYIAYQRNQPLERGLASLRQAWTENRPLEARVTGGFAYLPYRVTRGGSEAAPVNQYVLLTATAELARELTNRPTPQARHYMGKLHLLKGEFAQAEALLNEVIKTEPNNAQAHVDLGVSLYERAIREQSIQPLGEAVEHLNKATELAPQLAEAWFNRALCHEHLMLLTQAQADWERYLQLDANSQWAEEARRHLQKLRERAARPPVESINFADEVLAADRVGDEAKLNLLLAENFSQIAGKAWGQLLDRYLNATLTNEQATAEQMLRVLRHLAERIREGKGDHFFADQLGFLEKATAGQLRQMQSVRGLLTEAEQHYQQQAYRQAMELFARAKQAAEQRGDHCQREAAMYGMAKIYTPQTETPALARLRSQLVSLTSQNGHLRLQAQALAVSGNQLFAQQLFSSALTNCLSAHQIARRLGDAETESYSLRNIRELHWQFAQAEIASTDNYLTLSLLSNRLTYANSRCMTIAALAEYWASLNHHQLALQFLREALPDCQKTGAIIHFSMLSKMASYSSVIGQNEVASDLLHQALTQAEQYAHQTAMGSLLFGLYLDLGEIKIKLHHSAEAIEAFRKGQALLKADHFQRFFPLIHHGLARAYSLQGRWPEAEQSLLKSIEGLEKERANISDRITRDSHGKGIANIYRTMVHFQFAQKHSAENAFDFAERYRQRTLLESLSSPSASLTQPDPTRPLTLPQVQAALPEQTQLLFYTFTDTHLLSWLVNKSQSHSHGLPINLPVMRALVAEYVGKVRQPSQTAEVQQLAQRLYRQLIEPLAQHINPAQALVIVPDDCLQALPFAALQVPATNRFLIEEYDLSYSSSASVFLHLEKVAQTKPRMKPHSLLVVSDPKFDPQLYLGLQRLPGTVTEANALQALYPTVLHLGNAQATKQVVQKQMRDFEVIHLATHTLTDETNALRSAIVLAETAKGETNATDGALRAQEIFGFKLPITQIVILSSCRSNLGGQFDHTGFGTLAHAFFAARVPVVVGSLWEVDDDSTATLMKTFHQAFLQQPNSASQALRQAQLALLRGENLRWRQPNHWAAFMAAGAGGSAKHTI
jgi:CHAT domain-containing protein